MIRTLLIAAMIAAACTPRPAPLAAGPPAQPRAPALPRVGGLRSTAVEQRQQMLAHFAAVSALQRAVVHGELDEARRHARWLAEHDEPLAQDDRPFADEIRAAARAVAEAPDLPAAGAVTGRLGLSCGRCHEARATAVSFAWQPEPAEGPDLAAQMQRHQWAAARLWEGLIGPSDEMWAEGSRVMAAMRVDAAMVVPGVPRGDLAALAGQVRALAQRATELTGHAERGALYGELLSACAGCHELARGAR